MKRADKTKKQKKDVPPKKNKLDWQKFNFLENLLIFCTVPDRVAPPESGVEFRITKAEENSVCLLFEIDRRDDPLVREQNQKRPDYLSLFIRDDLLLLTIIEMKGTNKNSTDTGIEQITTFRDRLKTEIADHVTTKLKYKLQAILLTPHNADIPRKAITAEADKGFIILPLQYNFKAELYSYVSNTYKKADLAKINYIHEQHQESDCLLIEDLLARQASCKRVEDSYYSCNFAPAKDRKGIYIDYRLSGDQDWITLLTVPEPRKIQLAYCSDDSQRGVSYFCALAVFRGAETLGLSLLWVMLFPSSTNQIQNEIKNVNLSKIVEMVSRLVDS